MGKLAIIAEGGGLQAGFATGALAALNDKIPGFSLRNVDTLVASSASVGNMFWYFSGRENHIGRKMWTEELTSEKFILRNPMWRLLCGKPVLDVDYLVDVIFKQNNPLHIERIQQATEKLYFPVFNCDSGEIEFFSNHAVPGEYFIRGNKKILIRQIPNDKSVYEVIRAAKAIPFLYDKKVHIDGIRYIDGGIREPFTLDIPAIKNARKILIVSQRHGTLAEVFSFIAIGTLFFLDCVIRRKDTFERSVAKDIFKKAFLNRRLMKEVRMLQRKGELLLIEPEVTLGGTFDNSSQTMRSNYEIGEEHVLKRRDEILSFVGATIR
ncbi:MAG: patatin-like phospholipase family protein [Patescibacteria group bacterium]